MEDVRIYDYEFNLLHIEHDIISCNWTLYDNKIGTFEMHFPLTSRLSGIALSRPYLVAVQGSKQAIITGRQADTEGVLYGRSCSWILTRFCIADQFDTDSLYDAGTIAAKDAQTACRYIVNKAMAGVANFVVLTNSTDTFGDVYVENKGVTSAFDLISDCLDKDGAGHEVRFDVKNKRWTFRPSKGAELSVVLSDSNRNTYETEYTEDSQNYYTGGWYEQEMTDMGDWDAEANSPRLTNVQPANFAKAYRVTTAATRFGIAFAEGDYIVCNNKAGTWSKAEKIASFWVHIPSAKTGIYAWETEITGTTEDAAQTYLTGCTIDKSIKTKTRGLIYGKDYKLGDMVRVEVQKGDFKFSGVKKITGVNLWYENNDVGEQPIMEEGLT